MAESRAEEVYSKFVRWGDPQGRQWRHPAVMRKAHWRARARSDVVRLLGEHRTLQTLTRRLERRQARLAVGF
jgi:hypothetical protein